ncbi:MAG: hypothetical protein EOP04_00935 [Proteobacteria bacterium]|nr:MAG: hypothetical protein EOP04_00935 [Pseudomonadota bacterium]
MSTFKPYFITGESPRLLRKLLIKNPFLPTIFDNIVHKRPYNDTIYGLDIDDPLIDFLLQQLAVHNLVEKTTDGYKVKYSQLVPPQHWEDADEGNTYMENVLSYTKDIVSKGPRKKAGYCNYTAWASEADFNAFIEKQVALGASLRDLPDGSVQFHVTFITKQL